MATSLQIAEVDAASSAKGKKEIHQAERVVAPQLSEMINNAISHLNKDEGASLQAIKKYIAAKYKVDIIELAPFIREYIVSAVATGALVQTKGKGAKGSYKLGATTPEEKKGTINKQPAAAKTKKDSAKSNVVGVLTRSSSKRV
jgi:histone H1/5